MADIVSHLVYKRVIVLAKITMLIFAKIVNNGTSFGPVTK